MITLPQFITATTGTAVSYDGIQSNRGQCEQLVCLYWKEVLGFICPPIPAAKDLWTNSVILQHFDQIPVGKEQAGDVGVWNASAAIDSPLYGHTDIVVKPGFTGFDSNWYGVVDEHKGTAGYGYPAAHEVPHDYNDVLGFLRKKSIPKEELMNKGDVTNMYRALLKRDPDAVGLKAFVGQPWGEVFYHIIHSKEYAGLQK